MKFKYMRKAQLYAIWISVMERNGWDRRYHFTPKTKAQLVESLSRIYPNGA